jgi:hypothetical protein
LEFFFHLSQRSVGLLEVYTLRKAATFNPYFSLGLQMLISSFILFFYWCNWNWSQFNVNSSNFMVVHCLPCNYRIRIVFIAYIYMLQNLPAEINSIYAYINNCGSSVGALIFGEALTMVIAIGGGITILVCIW